MREGTHRITTNIPTWACGVWRIQWGGLHKEARAWTFPPLCQAFELFQCSLPSITLVGLITTLGNYEAGMQMEK